jgi:hypothetical protein
VDKRKQHEKLIEDKKISYLICISLAKLVRGEKSNDSDGLVLTNPFNTDYSRPYAWMVNDHDCLMGEILYGYKSKIRIHDGSNEAKYVRMKHSDEKVNRKSRKYNFFENSSHVSGVLVSYEDGIVMEENSYKSILFQNPNASLPLSDDQLDKLKKFSRVWEQ